MMEETKIIVDPASAESVLVAGTSKNTAKKDESDFPFAVAVTDV